jgi:hypothetical protein
VACDIRRLYTDSLTAYHSPLTKDPDIFNHRLAIRDESGARSTFRVCSPPHLVGLPGKGRCQEYVSMAREGYGVLESVDSEYDS